MEKTSAFNLGFIARLYLGIVVDRLEHLGIDRFFYPLLYIHENSGKISQQDLAEKLKVDKVYVVKIVDYLTKHGLVERKACKLDRRKHLLVSTSKAVKLIPEIDKIYQQTEAEMFQGFNQKEIKQLKTQILQLQQNLLNIGKAPMSAEYKKLKK